MRHRRSGPGGQWELTSYSSGEMRSRDGPLGTRASSSAFRSVLHCRGLAFRAHSDSPTQCAGIHRKMGTHITKVKSLTLDTWSREQVEVRSARSFGHQQRLSSLGYTEHASKGQHARKPGAQPRRASQPVRPDPTPFSPFELTSPPTGHQPRSTNPTAARSSKSSFAKSTKRASSRAPLPANRRPPSSRSPHPRHATPPPPPLPPSSRRSPPSLPAPLSPSLHPSPPPQHPLQPLPSSRPSCPARAPRPRRIASSTSASPAPPPSPSTRTTPLLASQVGPARPRRGSSAPEAAAPGATPPPSRTGTGTTPPRLPSLPSPSGPRASSA